MNNSYINLAFFSESTLVALFTELAEESKDLKLLKGLSGIVDWNVNMFPFPLSISFLFLMADPLAFTKEGS